MLVSPSLSRFAPTLSLYRRLVTASVMGVVLGLCSVGGAQAAPDQSDQVARFLRGQGLIAQGERGLLDHVRERASDLVITAMNFLGTPYRRGGASEAGFDCSGFTRHVFEQSIGLLLPRRAQEQAESAGLMDIQREELKPGDLVFFNTMRRAFSHVGIYVGDNKFIHAPRPGGEVRVEDMREGYWTKRFNGARRAPSLSATGPTPSGDSVRP